MNYNELLITAIKASILGGYEIMKIYESDFKVEEKDDNSPITLADMNCNQVIDSFLQKTNIPILSEEGSNISYEERKSWKYSWLVDPLDGTKEFIKRNGEFTVNIALIYEGRPILGVIYVPVKDHLYFSLEGLGSFKKVDCKNKFTDLESLIKNSTSLPIPSNRDNYVIVGSRSHMSKETESFFSSIKEKYSNVEIMSVGSSLKLCMVAEGKADIYPRYAPTMEWDTGAGDAICRMAGREVLQYNSKNPLEYNKENLLNPWFLVK